MTARPFARSPYNPILSPTQRWWESRGVLNPGAVLIQDRIAIVYRAVGGDGISRFGLAWSRNGEQVDERLGLPWYEGALDDPLSRLGVEDPRITPFEGKFLLTYCKVSLETGDTPPLSWEFAPFHVRSGVGITDNFASMRETGTIAPATNTKDAVLFPERIDGRYAALVREYPSIYLTTSLDFRAWSEPSLVMEPIPGTWEGERIGAGPPPMRTPWGWLLLYHGNEYLRMPNNQRMYCMGLAVLDFADPSRVLYRHPDPIFHPEAPYEVNGPVGNVVFGTGLVERNDRLLLYYGAGDGVIGVATAQRDDVMEMIRVGVTNR